VSELDLVASFFTLSGAGFGEAPRNGFEERCVAAAAAGFAGIGLHAADLPRSLAAGLTVQEMRDILTGLRLRVVELEFLSGWVAGAAAPEIDEIHAVAEAFGGRHVSAGEFAGPPGGLDVAAASRGLRLAAERLAPDGLTLAVEAFPWSALAGPTLAGEVIRRAAVPNVGLMIDVWHFYNSGATPALLEHLPVGSVAAVQLNDGPRVHENFLQHARADRRLPGDGDLDVVGLLRAIAAVGLLRAIAAVGYTGPLSVEANTPELRALPAREAANRAADAARTVLAQAGLA
jgi:sugar phosphate isomerase/epimerase